MVVSPGELLGGADDDLVVVVPLSSSMAPSALRIEVAPAAGIDRPSRAICRAIRALVAGRLVRRLGQLDARTMREIDGALGLILGLEGAAG